MSAESILCTLHVNNVVGRMMMHLSASSAAHNGRSFRTVVFALGEEGWFYCTKVLLVLLKDWRAVVQVLRRVR
jgi:hypothetical protein